MTTMPQNRAGAIVAKTLLIAVIICIVAVRAYAFARTVDMFWLLTTTALVSAALLRLLHRNIQGLLFAFGLVLPLFGDQSFTERGLAFDVLLSTVTLVLLLQPRPGSFNRAVIWPLWTFAAICTFSMSALPWHTLIAFNIAGYLPSLAAIAARSDPSSYLYGVSGVLRLLTLVIFACALSTLAHPRRAINWLALGTLAGAFVAAIFGILDYYGLVSLDAWRRLDPIVNANGQVRLQSVFGHPGWFAEFITVSAPFILLVFQRTERKVHVAALFTSVVLLEIALILAQARAGWLAWPATLLLCWAVFYQNPGHTLSSRSLFKAAVSVPATLAISGALVFAVAGLAHENSLSTHLERRALALFRAQDRMLQWRDGALVGMESPITGMGYQNYQWNAWVLEPVEGTHLHEAVARTGVMNTMPTPHNFYLSLFSGTGIAGLCAWIALMVVALFHLLRTAIHDDRAAIAYLGSILAFHVYALFQSMQYIGAVWLLIFLPLGYALTTREYLTTVSRQPLTNGITGGCLALLFVTTILGTRNLELSRVAAHYHMDRYGPGNRDFVLFQGVDYPRRLGFYPKEHWVVGNRWWTGQDALLKTHRTGLLRFDAQVSHPNIGNYPVAVDVSVDGRHQHRYRFRADGSHFIDVLIAGRGEHVVGIRVSRPFVPSESSPSKDSRRLGIALSAPQSVKAIGVYSPEHLPDGRSFRWTNGDATLSLRPRQEGSGIGLSVWAANPDIDAANPVIAKLIGGGREIRQVRLDSTHAVHIDLDADSLSGSRYLRILTNRTWVPADHGQTTDTRTLGVAISPDVR